MLAIAAESKRTTPLAAWILAGQSNMEGLAPLDDPRRDRAVDPRVEVLGFSGAWADASEPLHRLWESYTPVHPAIERAGLDVEDLELSNEQLARRQAETRRLGAGLGPAFASRMAEVTGSGVGLIPCAHGGTTLEQWSPGFGGAPDDSVATLYGSMLNRIARARSRDGVTVRGILWYQGESDATLTHSIDYAERFDHWIARVRADVGEPELPVIVAQLGRFAGPIDPGQLTEGSWNRIREAQRKLPRRVAATAVVSAVDLGLSDPIHVDAPGLARLGRRMATLAIDGRSGPDVESVEFAGAAVNGHIALRVRCTGVRGGRTDSAHLPGFTLCDRDGVPIKRLHVVNAHADPADPSAIFITTASLEPAELAGAHLAYGQGFDPICLAVDAADLPLPAFGPHPIEGI